MFSAQRAEPCYTVQSAYMQTHPNETYAEEIYIIFLYVLVEIDFSAIALIAVGHI
jgi:hypothetical protein